VPFLHGLGQCLGTKGRIGPVNPYALPKPMSEIPRQVKVRIGKRTYPVRTTLGDSQVRKLESLLDSLAFEEDPGTSQEERLVLLALRLAHVVDEAVLGLERLGGLEGKNDGKLLGD
jgi:hypothetical protein